MSDSPKQVRLLQWGEINYEEALSKQENLLEKLIQWKRKKESEKYIKPEPTQHYLITCTHPPVVTLGRNGKKEHLLYSTQEMVEKGISFHKTTRGGDITYHGPGQLVVYPILDLEQFFKDIHRYLRTLEEAIILTLADYSLRGSRIPKLTGVWINDKKVAAIGIRMSRWVSMHGLALNVCTHLSHFESIVPCGIADKDVTSIEKETGIKYKLKEVEHTLLKHLKNLLNLNFLG
ncbi:MAG: lipoyl(octanoyl) transferase LipB [Cytophagales bacterium]|nr:lipoyl(octanoyl) transferase LipB [Cytophagales bacterium]